MDESGRKLYLGGQTGKFVEYDINTGIATDRTSTISSFWSTSVINIVHYATTTNRVYIGGGSGKFAEYTPGGSASNLTSTISTFWSTLPVNAIVYHAGKVYLGGDDRRFAIYTPGGSATNAATSISSFWGSGTGLRDFAINTVNGFLYIGGGLPAFAAYNPATTNAYDKTTYLSSVWTGVNYDQFREVVYSPNDNSMYVVGLNGNFNKYITPYRVAQSTTVASSDIKYATLTASDTIGVDDSITYYLSNDGGATWNQVTKGSEYTFSSVDNDLRWKAVLTNTASIQEVIISYRGYASVATLTSSPFDTESDENIVSDLSWSEDLPAGTNIKFQIRTAPASSTAPTLPGTWTDFMGPDGTTEDYFENPNGGEIDDDEGDEVTFNDGSSDRWIQYRAYLYSTDGTATPTLSDVSFTYVVNSPPDFDPENSATAAQATTTEATPNFVTISYSVRDEDGDTGSGEVTPLFAYSIDGDDPVAIDDVYLLSGDVAGKSVSTSTYTTYTASWRASSTPGILDNIYTTNARIFITINDGEAANNTASTSTAPFTLDTKKPVWGETPLSVDASIANEEDNVTLSCSDDSPMEMRTGLSEYFDEIDSDGWRPYSAVTSQELNSGSRVFAQCRDMYGNESEIVDITIPATPSPAPSAPFLQDISDASTSDWRLFIAWGAVGDGDAGTGGFSQYHIWRSDDGGDTFEEIAQINESATNYYIDSSVSDDTSYRYKITVENGSGSISGYSGMTIEDTPDGSGGTDTSPPVLQEVDVVDESLNPTGVTITWSTPNELSDSTVYYVAATEYPGEDLEFYEDFQGVASMVNDHSVTLSGLTPNTQYYFIVESIDASGNRGQNSLSTYTFTTDPGPIISNVTTPSIFDEEATISWETNIPADSTVVFSTSAVLAEPTEVSGSTATTTDHLVTLENLTPGQRYYYYVKSEDGEGNESVDKNVVDGEIQYHTFTTTQDDVDPVITDVETALVGETGATITWNTDEGTISKVQWGETTALEFGESEETTTYSNSQAIILDELENETTYYYMVISTDRAGNQTTDDNGGARYSFTTLAPTVITETVTIRTGGGGGSSGRDTTPPTITNLVVRNLSQTSVTVEFTTSEPANQRMQYGTNTSYGKENASLATYTTSHVFRISGLTADTNYNYNVYVKDVAGNEASTGNKTFKTLAANETATTTTSVSTPIDPASLTAEENALLASVEGASNLLLQKIIDAMFKNRNISPDDVASSVAEAAETVISSPTISGVDIAVEAGPRSAVIRWATNKEANSMIAYAPESEYDSGRENPYIQVVGNPDESVKVHEVRLENLQPNTTYHYQTRSQSKLGPVTASEDRTFTTPGLSAEVTDVAFSSIKEDEATLKWKTSLPTQSTVEITDTRTGKRTEQEDSSFVKDHEFVLEDLSPSSNYTVKVISKDEEGNTGESNLIPLSTVLNKNPVVISDVRVNTSLIPGKVEKVQSIITWKTDKPSSSRVFYEEGVSSNEELPLSTEPDDSFTTEHIVITTAFKPGKVYRYRVESIDGYDNKTYSKDFTILTPRPKETVVDVIVKNFEQTFGFLKGGQ